MYCFNKKIRMIKDLDIRQKLISTILNKYNNAPDSIIIEELGLCQGLSRIDIAVVNGALMGYEIKSELDTLDRLPLQQETYNKILDYVTIVSFTSHLKHLNNFIPDWWGIIEVRKNCENFSFITHKNPVRNQNQDSYSIAQLLWKDEALEILEGMNLIKGLRSKPRTFLWSKLSESMSIDSLRDIVREKIKARGNWRVDVLQK